MTKKGTKKKQLQKAVPEQLDLLSKTSDKKTACDSKMSIKLFNKRPWDEMCEVELWWIHDLNVNSYHLRSFCPILPSTKAGFEITLKEVCLL